MSFVEFLGWMTTFLFNFSYVPQIYKICKTKEVEDISLGYLVFLLCAYICGLIYSTSIKAWPIVFSHGIGIACVIVYFVLYLKYKKVNRVQNQ
jgi:uncharacterized protein with PQ loop repeat